MTRMCDCCGHEVAISSRLNDAIEEVHHMEGSLRLWYCDDCNTNVGGKPVGIWMGGEIIPMARVGELP